MEIVIISLVSLAPTLVLGALLYAEKQQNKALTLMVVGKMDEGKWMLQKDEDVSGIIEDAEEEWREVDIADVPVDKLRKAQIVREENM